MTFVANAATEESPVAEAPADELAEVAPAPPAATLSTQDFAAILQVAAEQARLQAEATAHTNAEALAARLKEIEQTFREQREQDLATVQHTNRVLLVTVGAFAGAAVLGVLVLVWAQLRAMKRFSEAVATLPGGQAFNLMPVPTALGAGEMHLVSANAAEQSSARFLSTVERLEKRIHELEHTTTPLAEVTSEANGDPGVQTGDPALKSLVSGALSRAASEQTPKEDQVTLLLGKGQTLLNLDQPAEALACFESAVSCEPQNTEALIKKGTALERLRRFDEAVECFDRAIELDASQTMAYLHKGAVCNRLARYAEALACYEQALQTRRASEQPRPQSLPS